MRFWVESAPPFHNYDVYTAELSVLVARGSRLGDYGNGRSCLRHLRIHADIVGHAYLP